MSNLKHILILVLGLIAFNGCNAQKKAIKPKQIVAKIKLDSTREPITKYLYGQFIENLGNKDVGNLVDDGLWAEMLDDRKFFYPVDLNEKLNPVNTRATINQWKPTNQTAVVMDSIHPYVGVSSPKISTNNEIPQGIYQSGISVVANKNYVGRIVLSGSSNVKVTVSLVWGEKPNQKSSVTIDPLANNYKKYNFSFSCKESSTNAKLEITGLVNGTFSIGAVSLMPEDNIEGFRPEVIKLLKGLNSGIYRWGGNFISGYDWKDGVGDPDQRPPRYEYAWEGVEDNDVGTHEMIKFAELIGVELGLTVNTGFGDAYSAARWVEYVNGATTTPMGKLRTENGHPNPFNIKFWCVGNESYGHWQLGQISLKNHIIKHKMFADKMLEVDPTIKLIASGASIEEMTVTGNALKTTGKVLAEYDTPSDWTGGMLRNAKNNIDFMSEHFYCSVDKRFDITVGDYVDANEPLVDWTRRPANRIRAKAEHYKEYHNRIPGSEKIPVYLDEWAYYTNWVHPTPTLGVTIGYARALNEIFRNTDLIKMSGFTFGTSCLSFNDVDATYNTTGLLFKLYQSQFGNIPVQVAGNTPQPQPKWPIGGEQPKVNAGGDTYPLDIVATLSSDKKTLTVAIVNPTETDQEITIDLNGVKTSNKITKWTISGSSYMVRNIIGKEAEVSLKENTITKEKKILVGAATINIYKYTIL
ncbi:hypothetical protein [Flavobacterium sp. ZB4R12]|uniref:hypothetical protein n=1 Tax=Flavobacterium sp. ZB4R12 TaxID=3398732 RepID=UPI003AAD7C5C